MPIKTWVLGLFLLGCNLSGWGQWSTDLSQNTRVSAGFMHTYAYGGVAGDDGSVLVVWAESTGNASIMYAQRYRADGTVVFAKKELFRFTFGDCKTEGFAGLKLLRAAGSDDVFVIYTLTSSIVVQGGKTTYLQYQIISFADGTAKIPNNGNENRGLNLGYDYAADAPSIPFDANFIRDGANKVAVVWSQKNNPADTNRGGGGSLITLTDLRIAILDASNRTAPTAYFVEGDAGDQTNPRLYAQGERIFVSFIDRSSTIAVRKYKYPLNGTAISREWSGNAQYLGGLTDPQNLGIQPSFDDSNPLCIYSASGTGLSKTLKAHRFNPSTGTALGTADIGTADQIGGVKVAGGAFSLNTALIYTKNNRQVVRRFLGNTSSSAETPITQRSHGGDPTFEAIKIADSPEKYLFVGENRDNGELYGQVIRFDNTTGEGTREWGDQGKFVSNASGSRTGGRMALLNSNALFFLWRDERNKNSPCTSDAYAQVLDANGNPPVTVKPEIKNVRLSKKKFCSAEVDAGTDRNFTVTFETIPTDNTAGGTSVKWSLLPSGGAPSYITGSGATAGTHTINVAIPQGRSGTRWVYLVYVEWQGAPGAAGAVLSEASIDTLVIDLPSPKPVVPPPANVCTGTAAVPLTASGTNLKWYTTAAGGTGSTAAPTPNTSVAGTFSYYVTQNTNGCESLREEVKVTVTSTPTIAATANGTKPLSVCAGVAVTLSATDGFTSYSWSGPGFTNATRSPQLTTPVTGSYVVSATSTCGTARDTVKITVNPIPVSNAASSKSTYIVGEAIQLTSGSGTGYTYAWAGPNGYTSTQQNPTIPNATTTMSGDYTVTVTANGCSAKGTVTVSVTTQPVTGIENVSAATASACPGASVDVNFTIVPSNGVGTFNVFLTDANGVKIGTGLGNGTRSPIRVTIPTSATAGTNFGFLVETPSANPNTIISKKSTNSFTILQRATAQMLSPTKDTSIVARKTGDNLSARVRVQGSGPFTLNFSVGTRNVRNAGDTTLTFRFDNDGIFSLTGVSGACGVGGLGGTQNVRITLKRVVAVEADTLGEFAVSVFPNPTADRLNVTLKNGKTGQITQLRLIDGKGSLLQTQTFYAAQHQWEIGYLPVGAYWLEVVQGDKKQSFKVVKE
ncbi:MAG: T9SS type A sorting domain-containing protein [Spirosomataceae bacterium]